MRIDDRKVLSIFKLRSKRFIAPTSFRLWCWKVVLRVALFAGYPVVLVGAARTGKSLLLHKLTPGRVIDHTGHGISGGRGIWLNDSDVPRDIYSIDECRFIEPQSLKELMCSMATQRRALCLSAQRYCHIKEAIDAYRSSEKAKRVLLVVVGGRAQ
jgi:hypothetical protein